MNAMTVKFPSVETARIGADTLRAESQITSLELRKLIRMKYAWPGGYPMYGVTSDNVALCMDCLRKEYQSIARALRDNDTRCGWHVFAIDVNWEYASLYCDHCSKRIGSAYSEDEALENQTGTDEER